MLIFNAMSENHHPYQAKRLFFFRRHPAEGLGKRSKRGLGIKFGPTFWSGILIICLIVMVTLNVNGLYGGSS